MLRVVQIHKLQTVKPKQTALYTAAHLPAAKVVCLQVTIGLGSQYKAIGQAPALTQHHADTALTLAIAIRGCGIHKIDRPIKDSVEGSKRLLLGHLIGKGFRHVAQLGGADT